MANGAPTDIPTTDATYGETHMHDGEAHQDGHHVGGGVSCSASCVGVLSIFDITRLPRTASSAGFDWDMHDVNGRIEEPLPRPPRV